MGREDVLPFWFGESDQSTPSFIREAAIASLRDGETFYSENLGRPYLRQAISTYLTDLHQRPDRHRPNRGDRFGQLGADASQPAAASSQAIAW